MRYILFEILFILLVGVYTYCYLHSGLDPRLDLTVTSEDISEKTLNRFIFPYNSNMCAVGNCTCLSNGLYLFI